MSGGLSILFLIVFAFWPSTSPTPKLYLAIASYAAVWFFAVKAAMRNYELTEKQKETERGGINEQNRLLARQVEIAEQDQRKRLERERQESLPVIQWGGGSTSVIGKICEFRNYGTSAVTDLKATTEPEIQIWIQPTRILAADGTGEVKLLPKTGRFPEPFDFKISCTTKLNERLTLTFRVSITSGTPVEVSREIA
jgi:hypothetical protein